MGLFSKPKTSKINLGWYITILEGKLIDKVTKIIKIKSFIFIFLFCVAAHGSPIRILAIDGGGIKGTVEAVLMNEIERRTGKSIAELFHVVSGSSTGGILAAGLTMKNKDGAPAFTASQTVDLYLNNAKKIFSRSVFHSLFSFFGLMGPLYSHYGIEEVFETSFQDKKLTDVCTNLMLTGFDADLGVPILFKSWEAKAESQENYYLKDLLRATSAAPTYFSPALISSLDGNQKTVIDGALPYSSPALSAFLEAKMLYPSATEFIVVSIGITKNNRSLKQYDLANWGILNWAKQITSTLLKGSVDTVDYYLQMLAKTSTEPIDYYRFNVNMEKELDAIDRVDDAHLEKLIAKGQQIIDDNEAMLDALVTRLSSIDDEISQIA